MKLKLRERRERIGLSQTKVAHDSGIVQGFYSDIEAGRKRPSVETAKRIAEVLGFDWTDFFEDEIPKQKKKPAS